jgi:Mrp family chromosome partitioning ATPase
LNNLKTQLILVESEYDSLASTRTRGPQLIGKRAELAGLRSQVAGHTRRLAEALRSQLEIFSTQEKNVQTELKVTQDTVKRLAEQSARLLQGYSDPATVQDLGDAPAVESNAVVIVDRASPGTRPIRPRLALNLLFGLLLGGVLGFGGATLRTVLDSRIATPARVEALTSLPCLAALPRPRRASRGPRRIFTHAPFPLGMSFLRSWLIRSALGNDAARIVGIAPATSDFTASRTLADLAILLAEAEKRTLVVDLNFDNPTQARLLGVAQSRLAEWLASDDPVDGYIGYSTVRELAVLAPRKRAPGIENLLSRRPLSETLPRLINKWDFILIDAPPITDDSALMLTLPAGSPLLLAADARRSHAESIVQAARHARGPLWKVGGVVLLNTRGRG